MLTVVRIGLLLLIAWPLVAGVLMGVMMETGAVEKAVLAGFGAVLLFAASRVRRIGMPPSVQR